MGSLFDVDLESRAELEVALPRLLIIAGELTAKSGDLLIFGPYDLNVPKYSLLIMLAHVPQPLSMTEIGEWVLRSPSNLTQMVDNLEKRSLVRRLPSPTDRRVNLLEITDEGRSLLEKVQEQYEKVMANSLKDQSTEKLHQMVTGLLEVIEGNLHVLGSGQNTQN